MESFITSGPSEKEIAKRKLSPSIIGLGILPPLTNIERLFNKFIELLLVFSATLFLLCTLFIFIDIVGRLCFNSPWFGVTDLEMLMMSAAGFLALPSPIVNRENWQIDVFFDIADGVMRRRLHLFTSILAFSMTAVLSYGALDATHDWTRVSYVLEYVEWPSLMLTGICLGLSSLAFFFQICHVLREMINFKEYTNIILSFVIAILLWSLPFLYRASDLYFSQIAMGGIVLVILLSIMMLRAPLGFIMALMGLLGLLAILRLPSAAFAAVAHIPFTETASFMMIAIPMFLLMGEMMTISGLSEDLFGTAAKWFGHFPGGLAIGTVYGCAGFGAVCGESFATCLTMSNVALPSMEKHNYDYKISLGALAGGGTLGILIPPSTGFIVYSMITEQSVGKLFVSGIIPGILLATMFSLLIYTQVRLNPSLAPRLPKQPLTVRLLSLITLIPVTLLFFIVVFGILNGLFTPAEGGAAGVIMALLYAFMRRKLTWVVFKTRMRISVIMFGKIFALFGGLFVLSVFLASSRLPILLADLVANIGLNQYIILLAVTVLYIILGCIMSIVPMMILTLPTIYPTIVGAGFDPIWFGCYCVILMEMGIITPPVGLNIFTLAGIRPQVPMITIFRAAMPYFFCMLGLLILITIFPEIVLCLV